MQRNNKTLRRVAKVGIGAMGAVALVTGPALADPAPSGNDVVGVGSDAVQYVSDFAADGGVGGGAVGYNAAGNTNRVFNFDATGDANGRTGYAKSTTTSLDTTVVLRAGTNPVTRPNGGGAGISALLADSGHLINYVRNPAPPTGAQETTAVGAQGVGQLHTVQVATDTLGVAVAQNNDAPPGLSAYDLAKIYKGDWNIWSDIPGYSGPAPTATIIPITLPSTATTYKNFLKDLGAAYGSGFAVGNTHVQSAEQNDPTVLTGPDQILPIYKGRLALYASNYFHAPNGSAPLPLGAAVNPAVTFLTGTAPDHTVYASTTGYYIIFRASDDTIPAWQPGGVKNWAQELFIYKGTSKPFYDTTAGHADITAAGATVAYNDLGDGYSLG